jgi:hypothetical protein
MKIKLTHFNWELHENGIGYRVFGRGKTGGAWRGFDNPPSSSVEVKERVEIYLYSPCRSSWSLLG